MPSFIVTAYENDFIWRAIVCVMRTLLVLIAWSVAILIPEFQLAISLVGGIATCNKFVALCQIKIYHAGLTATIVAFVMPPLFHLKLMWNITGNSRKLLLIVILIFGIAATMITTGVNVQSIVTDNTNSTEITC